MSFARWYSAWDWALALFDEFHNWVLIDFIQIVHDIKSGNSPVNAGHSQEFRHAIFLKENQIVIQLSRPKWIGRTKVPKKSLHRSHSTKIIKRRKRVLATHKVILIVSMVGDVFHMFIKQKRLWSRRYLHIIHNESLKSQKDEITRIRLMCKRLLRCNFVANTWRSI